MDTFIFGSYPAFILFILPVWLWMLWHFSALAFEMDVMLKTVSAKNDDHIQLVRRAWKLFTRMTVAFVLSCGIHGFLLVYWVQSDYSLALFWCLSLPAGLFIFFSRALEPSFCRWSGEVSAHLPT